MSTNLRLDAEMADALREAALRSGRSQQEIIRAAIAKELGLAQDLTPMQQAVLAGLVEAPVPFQDVTPTLVLPGGTSTADLLEREDR